jgi:hypothetical protein
MGLTQSQVLFAVTVGMFCAVSAAVQFRLDTAGDRLAGSARINYLHPAVFEPDADTLG